MSAATAPTTSGAVAAPLTLVDSSTPVMASDAPAPSAAPNEVYRWPGRGTAVSQATLRHGG